jgi:hypothetical protein
LQELERLDDGLLICHAGIAFKSDPNHWPKGSWHPSAVSHWVLTDRGGGDWDSLNGPDTRFRFRFGNREPVELWGPEDHWEMFITLPRVTLARGENIRVDVWDRDATTQEYISGFDTTFNGRFPLYLEWPWVRLECVAWTSAQAHQRAKPLLEKVDAALATIDGATPSLERYDLGRPHEIDALKSPWFSPNLRYLAGHLGWDAPEVQARLERLRLGEAGWSRKWQAFLVAQVSLDWTPLDGGLRARALLQPAGDAVIEVQGAPLPQSRADNYASPMMGRFRRAGARQRGYGRRGLRPVRRAAARSLHGLGLKRRCARAAPRGERSRRGFATTLGAGFANGERQAGDLASGGGLGNHAPLRGLVDDADRGLERLARLGGVLGVERRAHLLHVGAHGGEVLLVAVAPLDTLAVSLLGRLNVRHGRSPK